MPDKQSFQKELESGDAAQLVESWPNVLEFLSSILTMTQKWPKWYMPLILELGR